jgi:glycosyltransferase involved in cell wall biosynthesis
MVNVAIVCRAKSFEETRRKLGWWAYPVHGLDWTFYPTADEEIVNKDTLAKAGHDLIVWEDWCIPVWTGSSAIPVYAVIVDSNTSPRRRKNYIERAKQADVLLIDQDRLSAFEPWGRRVYRWQYAVNEHLFSPRSKEIDVAYHVGRTDERTVLHDPLVAYCRAQGYAFTTGGGLTIDQYANRLNSARIVVHKSTHEQCRSHRFFDALASGACLLTDRVWAVPEDGLIAGKHFIEWFNPVDMHEKITDLLATGSWNQIAQAGHGFVMARHTWRTRAAELVQIIEEQHAKH